MHWPLLATFLLALSAGGPQTVALHPLAARGATPEAMQQLDAAIRIELARVGTVAPAAGGRSPGCNDAGDAALACLVAFGRSLNVQQVLHGEVRAHPDSYAVNLRLLDVASGREIETATASVNRDVEEMVWATRAQVRRLTAPAQYAGRLELRLPLGTHPRLADRQVAPDAALVLEPGLYGLELTHDGQSVESWVEVRFEQSVTVSMNEAKELVVGYSPWTAVPEGKLDLMPPVPPRNDRPLVASGAAEDPAVGWPRWPGYVLVAIGGAALVGGVVQQVRAVQLRRELVAMGTDVGIRPEDQQEYRVAREELAGTKTIGWVLLGTGAALTLGGGAYLLVAPSPSAGVRLGGVF
jgi:hypothetical protein